jgi:hypothetical protein
MTWRVTAASVNAATPACSVCDILALGVKELTVEIFESFNAAL